MQCAHGYYHHFRDVAVPRLPAAVRSVRVRRVFDESAATRSSVRAVLRLRPRRTAAAGALLLPITDRGYHDREKHDDALRLGPKATHPTNGTGRDRRSESAKGLDT